MQDGDTLLKVHAIGDIPAPYAAVVLQRLSRCYTVLRVFEGLTESKPFEIVNFFAAYSQDLSVAVRPSILWLPHETLQLKGVVLQSPGFWEFFGKWNPLEALRHYLNDRHERKKDIAYRNQAEAEKLMLANKQTKLKMVGQVIKMARDAGVPESEITVLYREMVLIPFLHLDTLQDKGLITYAEIPKHRRIEVHEDEPVDA